MSEFKLSAEQWRKIESFEPRVAFAAEARAGIEGALVELINSRTLAPIVTRVSGSKIRPKLEAIAGTLEKLTSLLTPSKGATVLEGHPDREYFYLRPGHGDDPGKNAAILSVFHYLDHRDPNVDAYAEYRGLPKPEAYQEVLSLLGKLGDAAGKALLQLPRTDADRTSDNKRDDTILMVAIVYEASGGTVHTHAIDGSDIDEVGPDDSLKGSRSSHFLDCLWEINRCLPDGAKLALTYKALATAAHRAIPSKKAQREYDAANAPHGPLIEP